MFVALLAGYFTFSMFRLSLGAAIPDIMMELKIDEVKSGILLSLLLFGLLLHF